MVAKAIQRSWDGTAFQCKLLGDQDDARSLIPEARIKAGFLFDTMRPGQLYRGGRWSLPGEREIEVHVWRTGSGERVLATLTGAHAATADGPTVQLTYAIPSWPEGPLAFDDRYFISAVGRSWGHQYGKKIAQGGSGPVVTAHPTSKFITWSDGVRSNPRSDRRVKNDLIVVAVFGEDYPRSPTFETDLDTRFNVIRVEPTLTDTTYEIVDLPSAVAGEMYEAAYLAMIHNGGQTVTDLISIMYAMYGGYVDVDADTISIPTPHHDPYFLHLNNEVSPFAYDEALAQSAIDVSQWFRITPEAPDGAYHLPSNFAGYCYACPGLHGLNNTPDNTVTVYDALAARLAATNRDY